MSAQSSQNQQMQRLPPPLIEEKHQDDYSPKVVSICPNFHGKTELSLVQSFKETAFDLLVAGGLKSRQSYRGKILDIKSEILSFYHEGSAGELSDELAKMMLLDASLIIIYMEITVQPPLMVEKKLSAFNNDLGKFMVAMLPRDLSLLRNQIPLCVVKVLINHRYEQLKVEEFLDRSETTTGSPPPLHSLSTTHHLPPPSQNQIRPHQPSLQIRRLPDAAVGFGLDCCCSISGEFHHPLCSGREQLWLCSASGAPAAAAPVTSTPRRSAAPNPDLKIGNSNRTTSFHEYRTTSFLHIVAGAKSAFSFLRKILLRESRRNEVSLQSPASAPLHLLEALHRLIVYDSIPPPPLSPNGNIHGSIKTKKLCIHSFRTATDLKAKGISFRHSPTNSLKDVNITCYFFYARIQLPSWAVSTYTKVLLKNLVAYELSPNSPTASEVTSYINLMKSLIDSAEDVKVLRERRILYNLLSSDEEAVDVINGINTYGVDNPKLFGHVREQIDAHCDIRVNTWIAELLHSYFRSPWTITAFIAANALLAITAAQLYYAVYPRQN